MLLLAAINPQKKNTTTKVERAPVLVLIGSAIRKLDSGESSIKMLVSIIGLSLLFDE
jgi:hypothetical protein